MKKLTEEEAYTKAANYCSKSEHCPSEIMEKLQTWGVASVDACQRIVCRLMEEKYIDEARFCQAFVHDKFQFNHWGRQKIAYYLRLKKLPQKLIDETLDTISDHDAIEEARLILLNKRKAIRSADSYEIYTKLMRFAASRGIEMDTAMKAYDLIQKEENE